MGEVWCGTDERLYGRPCAIKTVLLGGATPEERAERIAWFTREVEILSRLHHPAICDIRDVVADGDSQYLVMEFIEGRTLAEELAARGSPGLPESEVLGWAVMLCDALSYLHRQSPPIIFRDLKPLNIMLRPDGRVKLIDFGIARKMAPVGATVIGTPGYAPLEQYKGRPDARSDVYSLAATLHHLLTGQDPTKYPAFTFPRVRSLVPTISQHVDEALAQALEMDEQRRFSSMDLFAKALAGAAHAQESAASAGGRQAALSSLSGAGAPMQQATQARRLALNVSVSDTDADDYVRAVEAHLKGLLQARFRHPPADLGKVKFSVDLGTPLFVPWAIAFYTVNATFTTSVGIIHREQAKASLVLDGKTGAAPRKEDLEYVFKCIAHLNEWPPLNDNEMTARLPAAYPPALPEKVLHDRMVDLAISLHTRSVQYYGANGRLYQKTCTPSKRDVTLDTEFILRVMMVRASVRIGNSTYSVVYARDPASATTPVVLDVNLPNGIPLCQECGGLDDRQHSCPSCGRFLCSRCLPPLLK